MMKRLSMIVSVVALLTLITVQATAKEITVRGRLAQTVESGGWLIITKTGKKATKYLLLNAQRFQNEQWFRVGALVEARGEVKRDVMTIYQEGTPFEARSLRSIRKARATAWMMRLRISDHFDCGLRISDCGIRANARLVFNPQSKI